jgi:hypothetical protein
MCLNAVPLRQNNTISSFELFPRQKQHFLGIIIKLSVEEMTLQTYDSYGRRCF